MAAYTQEKGFTLLEVLVSTAIIGVGLIALVTLFPIGLRSSRLAGDFTTASFIGQRAIDNIRAAAQVYDPDDTFFDNTYNPRTQANSGMGNTDRDSLGFYELPISAVKVALERYDVLTSRKYGIPTIRFPTEPTRSQVFLVKFFLETGPPAVDYRVYSSLDGYSIPIGEGNINALFNSDGGEITFVLSDNSSGMELGSPPYDANYDINFPLAGGGNQWEYDDLTAGDEILIHVELHGGAPYYWYAMRAPLTEDANLNGILEGRMPDGTVRPTPYDQVQEDTGLDLVPDFFDTVMRDIGTGTSGYQQGLDTAGEFTTAFPFPHDPHGDNRYAYYTAVGWFSDPTNAGTYPLLEINPNGTEGNGQIDARPGDDIQKVTVTVGWREGSQDRTASFSASIPNQFR